MSDIQQQVAEILAALEAVAVPERATQSQKVAPSAQRMMGVRAPELRPIVRDWTRRLRRAPPQQVLTLALALAQGESFEGRIVGYMVLAKHKAALASVGLPELEALARGMDNWAAVDSFALLLAGVAWREGRIDDATVHSWARSQDRWWRRAAVVSTVPLNLKARGGRGDAPRTLRLCRLALEDRDDMVIKGLSWALRELSKREPRLVRAFMEEQEAVLAARVKREVRRKLETGRK